MYRLFIDEVGNDSLASAVDPREQYLCLLGVILDFEYAYGAFTESMDTFKETVFGTKELVLHRKELLRRSPTPYDILSDPSIQHICDSTLMTLITESKYVAIAVMIDKKALVARYPKQVNPYHYCLVALSSAISIG